MERIDHKTVWVIGASSGIGEALTYELNQRNCKLIISSRRVDELERVKNNCEHPESVSILSLDLEDFDKAQITVNQALEAFGEIDILLNSGGISQRSLIKNTEFGVYKKLIDVNYLGSVAISNALLTHFIDRQKGHFVTITSLMGRFGSPYRSGYCAAKHALHGFFDVMRMEHEKDNIDVTLICPGFVRTNVAKNSLTADGTPQNEDDIKTLNGLEPKLVAKKTIKAIEQKKFEVAIGGKEVQGVYLKRFFPKLLHRLVLKSSVK